MGGSAVTDKPATPLPISPEWRGHHESFIRCPHCGKVHRDSCDYPDELFDDTKEDPTTEFECEHCEAVFIATSRLSRTYVTEPKAITDP